MFFFIKSPKAQQQELKKIVAMYKNQRHFAKQFNCLMDNVAHRTKIRFFFVLFISKAWKASFKAKYTYMLAVEIKS